MSESARSPEFAIVLSTLKEAYDIGVSLRQQQRLVPLPAVPTTTLLAIYDRLVAQRAGRPVIVLPPEENEEENEEEKEK